jgi:hypothetical protein
MEATAKPNTETGGNQPVKRHMRNYLLDKRFQLRWVLRVVVTVSIIVAVMGYFLYKTVGDATDQITMQKMVDTDLTEEAQKAFIDQAERDKILTIIKLVTGLVTLVVLLGLMTIVATHKIAGPAYKMRKLFTSIDGTKLQLWGKLRKADELQEAFVDFDNMIRRIREHRRDDIEKLESIRSVVADGKADEETMSKLDEIIKTYHDSVKMD